MRPVVLTICAAAALWLTSSDALAHMKLTRTAPEDGAALSEAPESVQVWYSQAPDVAVSKLTLTGPGGEVALRVRSGPENSLEGLIQGDGELPDGSYVVSWQAAGDDGHIQKGEYSFTLKRSR